MVDLTELAADADADMVYAVGDVHGRLDLLERLEAIIQEDVRRKAFGRPVICYLGDYVDRGPQSAGVIEWLARSSEGTARRIYLKGNHEDRMLAFLEHPEANGPRWLEFGGRQALASYGIETPEDAADADWPGIRDALKAALPPSHLRFLNGLQLAFRWRDHLFVHAGLHPERGLADQEARDLMWIREPFLSSGRDWGARVVHGHVIEPEPVVRPNRIGIDTGAYRTGRLTCLVAETPPRFLSARLEATA